jgi:enoyl-CoA hydratase/carnithine racemase
MDWEFVLLEKKDKIATITLNRPEKFNAFAGDMRKEILEAVNDTGLDPGIRVIVITGAGDKAFC